MNVLSLFDGMSCGQIALKELGIPVEHYFASEIDKHAIAQTQLNFPDTIQLGDVTKVKASDLPKIDLVLAGSPCQGFSIAGKQLNFNDPRSALFFEFVRILNEVRAINPNVKFLFENVRMKREFEAVISEHLGITPVVINSSLVSAQNRVRLYWSNIRTRQVGLFGELETYIPQPKNLGLKFIDIMEDDVPERYYLSEKVIANLIKHKEYNKGNNNGFGMTVRNIHDKSIALTVGGRGIYDLIATAEQPVIIEPGTIRTFKVDGGFRPIKFGKAGCLYARGSENGAKDSAVRINSRIRRYTPTECSRLQTIPQWYKWECSETQLYKMLGNGWTVKVIMHIL